MIRYKDKNDKDKDLMMGYGNKGDEGDKNGVSK